MIKRLKTFEEIDAEMWKIMGLEPRPTMTVPWPPRVSLWEALRFTFRRKRKEREKKFMTLPR